MFSGPVSIPRTMHTVLGSRPDPPILRLPAPLRRQIYSHFHDALGRTPRTFRLHGRNSNWYLGFRALLLVCRTIYDEVSEVLYSTNFFELKYSSARSLRPLRNLRGASLSSLTELKIVLNEVSCHDDLGLGRCCDDDGIGFPAAGPSTLCREHRHCHDQALWPSDDSAIELLDDWRLTAAYIWSRVDPRKLEISLVCDFDPQCPRTLSAARLAVAPLINLSPLRGCHVRLCRTPHRELEQTARYAVLRARGIINQEEPASTLSDAASGADSMLLSLPRELRFRILEHTDLITPWREVRWSSRQRGYLPTFIVCSMEVEECPAPLHHGCQFRSCWTGFTSLRAPASLTRVGCFCRRHHAAFSLNCRCWTPPTDLFLVCRTLYRDAQVVFFSGNRFVVEDYKWYTPWGEHVPEEYPNGRLAVSRFLREVVPNDCLHLIRSLEMTFPPYHHAAWPRDGCPALQDWPRTVRLIKERMSLEGLTLRLTMFDMYGPSKDSDRHDITEPQADEILQAYTRILGPLAGLGEDGLKSFYAYITLPQKWALWFRGRQTTEREPWGSGLEEERMLKERAELLVMGGRYGEQPEDEFYMARVREPVNSVWRRSYWGF